MAFGAVRKPYSAPCRFFSDESGTPNRIRWYIVPDDTPYYEGATVFWPRVDVPTDQALTRFEKEGHGRYVRQFWRGIDFWGYPADHVDGDAADFLGQSKSDKYAHERPCEGPVLFQWIFLTGRCLVAMVADDTTPVGFKLGGLARVGLPPDSKPAVKIGLNFLLAKENPIIEFGKLGINLAMVCKDIPFEPALLPLGVAIAGAVKTPGQVAEQLEVGLAIAGQVKTPGQVAEQLEVGLAIAGEVKTPGQVAEQLEVGLAIAGEVDEPTPPIELLEGGLAIAGEVDELEGPPSPPTPGTTCADAGIWPLGESFAFNITAGASQVFKFPITSGQQYYVKLTPNSGSISGANISTGVDCAGLNPEFSLFSFGGCNTFTKGFNGIGVVFVTGDFFNPGNYTLECGLGACP